MKVTSIEKNLAINQLTIFLCASYTSGTIQVDLTERQAHVHMLVNGDWKQPTAS